MQDAPNFFQFLLYWAFIIMISKTFSHENGDHKIEYSVSTWHTKLESLLVSPIMWTFSSAIWNHTFLKKDHAIEGFNNHIFIFIFQPRSDPMYDTRSRWHNVMPSMTQVSFFINKVIIFWILCTMLFFGFWCIDKRNEKIVRNLLARLKMNFLLQDYVCK